MLLAFLSLPLPALTIDNLSDGAELRYPLAMVRGTATGSSVAANGVRFPVVEGRFIALVELKPGLNTVTLSGSEGAKKIKLTFRPPTTEYKVIPVWLTSKDGTGTYYTTFPGRPQKAKQKFDLAMKMLQCFTAEAMNDAGFGRKTFALDLDEKGVIKLKEVRLEKTTAELHAMAANDTWGHIYSVLKKVTPEAISKWVALLSATDYDKTAKKALSHFALGGGALAGFGTGSMDFWPASIAEIPAVFDDGTKVDPNVRFEDSGNRFSVWANVATAYGAMLHELGHTLGLPHTVDRYSIMSRGFDFFNRRFALIEAPSSSHAERITFPANEVAYFDQLFATRLNWNKWLQPDRKKYAIDGLPSVKIVDGNVNFHGPLGIRVICAESDSRPGIWQSFHQADPPKAAKWDLGWIRERIGGADSYRITVVDNDGNQATVEDKPEAS